MALTKAKPHIKAVLQDLPSVVEQAQEASAPSPKREGQALTRAMPWQVWAKEYPEAVQKQRVQFVPIDFFADAPVAGCDFYYVSAAPSHR